MTLSIWRFVLTALLLPTSSIRATLSAQPATSQATGSRPPPSSGQHEARQMGNFQQLGDMPGVPGGIEIDIGQGGGGDDMGMPAFVEDVINQFQSGSSPGNPMDTQPFVNTTSMISTSTTIALPGGGSAQTEQTVNLVQGQAQVTEIGHGAVAASSGDRKSDCAVPRQTVTKTVTLTGGQLSATLLNTIYITDTSTKTDTVTVTDSPVVQSSESRTTQTVVHSSLSTGFSTSIRTSFSTSTRTTSSTPSHTYVPSSSTSIRTSVTSSSSITTSTPTQTYSPPPTSQPVISSASSTTLAPPPSASSSQPASGFQGQVLDAHNEWRAKYGAGPVAWDDGLATTAVDWANKCIWQHGPGASNLDSAASSDGKPSLNGSTVVNDWINGPNEASAWNPQKPVASHFTQVVWKATKKIGCAMVECDLSLYDASWWPAAYAVCYYDTGNDVTVMVQNVGSLQS